MPKMRKLKKYFLLQTKLYKLLRISRLDTRHFYHSSPTQFLVCLSLLFKTRIQDLNPFCQDKQVILCQINTLCHYLTQTDFVRFMKICRNCSEIQKLQNLCFKFQNILWQNKSLYFEFNWWQNIYWSYKDQPVQFLRASDAGK